MTQTKAERRLSKVAAALNQAWKKTGNPGYKLSATDLAGVYMRDDGECQYCGIELTVMAASFDHVIALNKGGENRVRNLALSCVTCQRSKHTKTPEEYATWQKLERVCPIDGTRFRPRWADYQRGLGYYCSRACSGKAATRRG